MGLIVRMPLINVNDEAADLVRWEMPEGAAVRRDDVLCIIETTKSTVEVQADAAGILRILAEAGARYAVGHALAFLAASADEPLPAPDAPEPAAAPAQTPGPGPEDSGASGPRWTKKARIVADRLGVDLEALAERHPGVTLTEDRVRAAALAGPAAAAPAMPAASAQAARPLPAATGALAAPQGVQRVLILGGGGGAALVLDILARGLTQQAVAILDNNPALAGTDLMGVPILGGFDQVEALWRDGRFDALISTVVRDVADRAAIFERFTAMGIPFTNVIDPDVRIGREVHLGSGNLVIYGGYLATGVHLGDNNFLAAGTFIEHHSRVGSHCTFGPRCALSGKVIVGDRVKFGMQVAVEPQIEIGAGARVASGVVLTGPVPAHALVKSSAVPSLRRREDADRDKI